MSGVKKAKIVKGGGGVKKGAVKKEYYIYSFLTDTPFLRHHPLRD